MQCVILAGGLATRMRPLTEKIPKTLLPAGDHPFAHYQLDWLSKHGVTDVVFSIGYKGALVKDYVQSGARWGLTVTYVDEGENLRGTGGALRLCLDQGALAPEFLITYGDSFLPIDFSEVWRSFLSSGAPALMTVLENDGKWDQSNACYSNGRVALYDKRNDLPNRPADMRYIDYGLLALKRFVVENEVPPNQKHDLAAVFSKLSTQGNLAGFEVKTRFYEIGSPSGLEDFKSYVAGRRD